MPETLQTRFGFATATGKHETNEDFACAFAGQSRGQVLRGMVAAIADGMSGGNGGRQAAETLVRGFLDAYYSLPETLGVERAASRALSAMNRWICAQARQDPKLKDMATTFSTVILRGREAHVIHIGDTRVYRLRDHRLQQLTTDHIHAHPDLSHVLIRAVGLEDSARIDHDVHPLNRHDRFLLCSDGVHSVLSGKRIQEQLATHAAPEEAARGLVELAHQLGGQDDATALVVDVLELPPPDQSSLEAALDALPIQDLPETGEEVDGFRLQEVIANGRYSRLFRAWDTVESREVVLKFPHPRVEMEAAHRRAFAQEAWVAARVRSPYVMETIELPPLRQTRLYSVLPHFRGETLEARLSRRPKVSLEEGIDIGLKLAKAIHALHRLRVIHRDIKPDNVMLVEGGGLKLLDLGVARLPGMEKPAEEGAPGTPSYMAPELFRGGMGDERSDVYALGVTLYRMFSGGHYPYGEVEPFSQPRFSKRTALTHHRPELPAWLDLALARATAVEAEARFGDAMELAFEFENGLAQGGAPAPRKKPLYERNPLRFWQVLTLLLTLALIGVLATRSVEPAGPQAAPCEAGVTKTGSE
jgi:serine/threonine protein phosphatase PrpC